jgi:hypothetical protein
MTQTMQLTGVTQGSLFALLQYAAMIRYVTSHTKNGNGNKTYGQADIKLQTASNAL